MKADDIIDVYKSKFKKIAGYCQKLPEDFEMKDIHHFRVEMKKLRAFIRLINLATPEHQHAIPKQVKKFYNIAGHLRNLQLHQQRIASLADDLLIELPKLYLQHLKEEEKSTKEKARETVTIVSLKEFEKELTDSAPDSLGKDIKSIFVQRKRLRLEALITLPCCYDEALHDIRKAIKDLMYNYKYLELAIEVEIPPALVNLRTMEELTSALGDFHDLCVALHFVSPIYIGNWPDGNEVELLNELKNQLLLRKEAMKNKIVCMLMPLKKQVEKEKQLITNYYNKL